MNEYENELLETLKDEDQETRALLLNLIYNYKKIKHIDEYEFVENKIYNNSSLYQKLIQEKERLIAERINKNIPDKYLEQYEHIIDLFSIISDESIFKKIYPEIGDELVNSILELEIKLNMDIYLYSELINYYNDTLKKKYKSKIDVKTR